MDIINFISIGSGIVSIVLAIVAIWFSMKSERESRENYDKTKEVLSSIKEKSAIVETTVTTNQQQLLDTVTKILEAIAIPKEPDKSQEMGMMMLQEMSKNPETFNTLIEKLSPQLQDNQKE